MNKFIKANILGFLLFFGMLFTVHLGSYEELAPVIISGIITILIAIYFGCHILSTYDVNSESSEGGSQ